MHRQCTVQAAFLVSATFAGRSPLGGTSNSATSPVKRIIPIAAAPAALAGLAAAFTLGNTHAAAPATTDALGDRTSPAAITPHAGGSAAQGSATELVSIARQPATGFPVVRLNPSQLPAPKGKHHRTTPAKYVVQSGDTLASVAQHVYHSAAYWPVLYWANHNAVKYASEIQAGQVLAVPAKPDKIPAAPKQLVSAPAPAAPAPATSTASTASTAQAAPVQAASSYTGTSSFQECVISHESGGNSQVMNSSGHYGLYQFSAATWAAYGGNPADFGNASVAEQNQVFANAMAAGGESNWAPYDGC